MYKRQETDDDGVTVRARGEPDESYRTTSPSGGEGAGSSDDADTRIAKANIGIDPSGRCFLPDDLAVSRRARSDTLAEQSRGVTTAVPADLTHRHLDRQIGLT